MIALLTALPPNKGEKKKGEKKKKKKERDREREIMLGSMTQSVF